MSRPGGKVATGAGFAAAKGAAVIGIAVLLGVVLLQVVDDGTTGPVSDGDKKPAATTTTEKGGGDGDNGDGGDTTTTGSALPPKAPDQIRVLVLNGGGPAGSAKTMHDALVQKTYTNQAEANNDDQERSGNLVHCRQGLEREAAALAIAVGEGTPTEPWPDRAVPYTDGVDCVVIVGAQGGTATTAAATTTPTT